MLAKLTAIQAEAQRLLSEHGLTEQGWTFKFSNTKRSIADCDYRSKQIRFSLNYAEYATPEDITDTLLHEIAHALTPKDAGHGREWRSKAVALGAKPETCAPHMVTTAKHRYTLICPECKRVWKRHRLKRPRVYFCPYDRATLSIYETQTRQI